MKYLVGIDNGGTFSKAAIFDENGNQQAAHSMPTQIKSPRPGFTQRDMKELWQSNAEAIRQAIGKSGIAAADIAGVSLAGHGKGLYLVGYDGGSPYDGIVSTDNRAWKQVRNWYRQGINEEVYKRTVQEILACQPVSLLAWLKEHEPAVIEQTKYIFSVKDYVRYCLTGEAYGEYTDFSGGNLINLRTRTYDRELLALFDLTEIYEKLPPLRHSSDICGRITAAAAELTGLPEGIPVAAGMFDVDACGIASGLVAEDAMCMIAGTWSINEFITTAPIDNGTVALNSMYCIPGYYLVEESSPTSAGNLEWFIRSVIAPEQHGLSGSEVYRQANQWVAEIEPGDSNVIFLPFLNGSGDNPIAKGSFLGLTSYHSRKHMLRAVYEGIVFSHLNHVNRLLQNRARPDCIYLSGGAVNSEVWVQIFADVLQLEVAVVRDKEIGAQGAAMAAGIAAGIYRDYNHASEKTMQISKRIKPRREYAEIYQQKYAAYQTAAAALNPVWEKIEME